MKDDKRLVELSHKTAIEVVELNFEIVGDPHDRIAQAIKLAIQEYTSDLHQSLAKANEELVMLRDSNRRLKIGRLQSGQAIASLRKAARKAHDAMINWFSSEYANHPLSKEVLELLNQGDSAIAAQEKMK